MRKSFIAGLLLLICCSSCRIESSEFSSDGETIDPQPIRLHPRNRRYLEFRNQPTILITSAEHYGSVINTQFDYIRYLDTLAADGLNYTRIFTGSYIEGVGSFGIEKNTLAPNPGNLLVPWARSDVPSYENGGNKFDLDRWDPEYFERLRDFVAEAGERSIIVEVTFFSSIYRDAHWKLSPLHPSNNIRLQDGIDRRRVHTMDNGRLIEYQEALVRKIVRELNEFDNVIYEIQNEPWADLPLTVAAINPYLPEWKEDWKNRVDLAQQPSIDWQKQIASFVQDEESALPYKHLIAQNISNFRFQVSAVEKAISILNFHYAYPESVSLNRSWERPVSFDESGFAGAEDEPYRRQAWRFIMAGGAVFNNLDYSFYPGAEDGRGTNNAPGGGGVALRTQLRILKDFIHGFNFVRLRPGTRGLKPSHGTSAQVLSADRREYAIYMEGLDECSVSIDLAESNFKGEWIDPVSGETVRTEDFDHAGGSKSFEGLPCEKGIALGLFRQ